MTIRLTASLLFCIVLISCRSQNEQFNQQSPLLINEVKADEAVLERALNAAENVSTVQASGFHRNELSLDLNVLDEIATQVSDNSETLTLYSGCRAHECDTKGYVALNRAGNASFYAVQFYAHCGDVPRSPCSDKRIILFGKSDIPNRFRLELERIVEKKCATSTGSACVILRAGTR